MSAEASKYSADDLKSLAFTVGGKPWDGNDLADPSAMEWTGLPDGWTVGDSTRGGIRTLAFTAPDGTVGFNQPAGTGFGQPQNTGGQQPATGAQPTPNDPWAGTSGNGGDGGSEF